MGKKMSRCVVIGAAPVFDLDNIFDKIDDSDFIICADGGMKTAEKLNITPDILIGDLDSFDKEAPDYIKVIKLPAEKDDTDMMCAVKKGIELGFKDFLLLGGLGGRLDHTFANLGILKYLADKGIKNMLCDGENQVLIVNCGNIKIRGKVGSQISLFPFGNESCLISSYGLKYKLKMTRLYSGYEAGPMGISNVLVHENAGINVHEGNVLIIMSIDWHT